MSTVIPMPTLFAIINRNTGEVIEKAEWIYQLTAEEWYRMKGIENGKLVILKDKAVKIGDHIAINQINTKHITLE